MSLEELMTAIKHRAMEKAVYTRNENAVKIRMEELPPIIPKQLKTRMLSTVSTQSKVRFKNRVIA